MVNYKVKSENYESGFENESQKDHFLLENLHDVYNSLSRKSNISDHELKLLRQIKTLLSEYERPEETQDLINEISEKDLDSISDKPKKQSFIKKIKNLSLSKFLIKRFLAFFGFAKLASAEKNKNQNKENNDLFEGKSSKESSNLAESFFKQWAESKEHSHNLNKESTLYKPDVNQNIQENSKQKEFKADEVNTLIAVEHKPEQKVSYLNSVKPVDLEALNTRINYHHFSKKGDVEQVHLTFHVDEKSEKHTHHLHEEHDKKHQDKKCFREEHSHNNHKENNVDNKKGSFVDNEQVKSNSKVEGGHSKS